MRALGRLPLALRAPLLAAGLMVLVGFVASQQVLSALSRAQEARLAELARLHVDGLSVALGPAVLRRDVWEVYDTLDRAANAQEGRRMRMTAVADETGRVLAASDPLRAPTDAQLAALAEGAQPLDAVALSAEARIRVLAPLAYQGRAVGAILTELDVSDLVAERREAMLLLLLGNAVATGGLALAGYLAMRRALRPLAQLSERMGADGGAPGAIPETEFPRGDTEVARLFRTYNGMVEAIAARADAERRLASRERFVSLGRLASSLAHEINNPLGGMLAAVDTVERYADRPDTVRASAALLARGLRRLRDVARAALDHNRLDAEEAPLGALDFEDLRLLVSPEIARLGQRLGWSVRADDLALGALPAAKMRQIALNLLLNASAAAGRDGAISLDVAAEPGAVRLVVRDDGPGLDPAARARLLDDGPAPEGGGLGLRITRDLVRGLGGRIEHVRKAGETAIAVIVPRADAEAAA
ncbi:MAG: sensor histidine kinase [Rubrimonas sp.]